MQSQFSFRESVGLARQVTEYVLTSNTYIGGIKNHNWPVDLFIMFGRTQYFSVTLVEFSFDLSWKSALAAHAHYITFIHS